MKLAQILDREWALALGCTEPASIALAAAHAAQVNDGPVKAVHLVCDARLYKNCYAVGIPHSDGIVGGSAGQSLDHLERIAGPGMQAMDEEILRIMQDKLR